MYFYGHITGLYGQILQLIINLNASINGHTVTVRNVSHSYLHCGIPQHFLYLMPAQFKSAQKCENNKNHRITMNITYMVL